MKSSGRPMTRQIKLMDGFYIEVRNRGSRERGIKIRSTDKSEMENTIKQYERNRKEVIILGEHKDDVWI